MERELQGKDFLCNLVLGSLPEQGFLERNIPWYSSQRGVNISAITEMFFCGVLALTMNDYAILPVADGIIAGTRVNMPEPRRGFYALEIPYEIMNYIAEKLVMRRLDSFRGIF